MEPLVTSTVKGFYPLNTAVSKPKRWHLLTYLAAILLKVSFFLHFTNNSRTPSSAIVSSLRGPYYHLFLAPIVMKFSWTHLKSKVNCANDRGKRIIHGKREKRGSAVRRLEGERFDLQSQYSCPSKRNCFLYKSVDNFFFIFIFELLCVLKKYFFKEISNFLRLLFLLKIPKLKKKTFYDSVVNFFLLLLTPIWAL